MKDVCSLDSVIEKIGNPFEESQDLVLLDTKEIVGPASVETAKTDTTCTVLDGAATV